MVRAIDRQPAGLLTWRKRPAMLDRQLLRIDVGDLTLVFDVHEDVALAIADGELRLSFQRNRAHDFAIAIEDRGVLAAAIEREYVLRRRIVEDGVGIVAGDLHFGDRRQIAEIENRHRAGAAVADEAAAQIGRDGDAVHAFGLGDRADDFLMIEVHDLDAIAVRNVQPSCGAVDSEVIPAAVTSDVDVTGDVIGSADLSCGNDQQQCEFFHSA